MRDKYTYCGECGKKLIAYEEDDKETIRHCINCIRMKAFGHIKNFREETQ